MDLTNSETTSQPGQPALTVVLPTIDNYQRIQKTLTHLQAQTARSEIEVLIVASSKGALKLDPAVAEGFFDLRVIEVGEIHSLAVAKTLAVAEARADWVVFGEDHSWPEPRWARALINAHAEGHAVVGPIIENANPGSALSWTNYLACFSRWSHSGLAGPVPQTPWHNSSYRRDCLVERQDQLPRLLAVEGILQDELRQEGHSLYLLPDIRPLSQQDSLMPRILPALVLNLLFHALGEVTGYVLGKGDAEDQYLEFEARRFEAICEKDREALGVQLPRSGS